MMTGLSPTALTSAAPASARCAPTPVSAAPQPEGPRGAVVHHSYIWLGSLRTAFMLLAIVVFSSFSAIIRCHLRGQKPSRAATSPCFSSSSDPGSPGIVVLWWRLWRSTR